LDKGFGTGWLDDGYGRDQDIFLCLDRAFVFGLGWRMFLGWITWKQQGSSWEGWSFELSSNNENS